MFASVSSLWNQTPVSTPTASAAPTTQYERFRQAIETQTGYDRFMYLTVHIPSDDPVLREKYREHIDKHNEKIIQDPTFADAGFDLLAASLTPTSDNNGKIKVDFGVQCSAGMFYLTSHVRGNTQIKNYTTGYYMYPRSSIHKTVLRLANNTGIIDAGYRGNIMGFFDKTANLSGTVPQQHDRLVQLCAPNLVPIYVHLANTAEELGPSTSRGEGGFGSTGTN